MEKRSRGWTLAYQSQKYLNLVENELLHSIPKQPYSCPQIPLFNIHTLIS